MGRYLLLVCFATFWFPTERAWSQTGRTIRYPKVYGPTGRPYGPTQAYYQYQKQYGRPWHGYGGLTAKVGSSVGLNFVNGYPAGGLSYGYAAYYSPGFCNYGYGSGYGYGYGGGINGLGYNPFFSYTPNVPPVINGYPPVLGSTLNPLPYNAPLNPGFTLPVNPAPIASAPARPVASTPEAKLKSLRAQTDGDMWFKQQEFHKAFSRYKTAVSEASDQGEAHFRLAMAYAALGHFDLASRQLKVGAAFDPKMTSKVQPLSKLYGAGNAIAQDAMMRRATLWVKEDVRDADRLFLLGVLLYMKGDERASILLETGLQLDGGDHLRSFLLASNIKTEANRQRTPANNSPTPAPQVINQAPLPQRNRQNPNNNIVPPLPAPPVLTISNPGSP